MDEEIPDKPSDNLQRKLYLNKGDETFSDERSYDNGNTDPKKNIVAVSKTGITLFQTLKINSIEELKSQKAGTLVNVFITVA